MYASRLCLMLPRPMISAKICQSQTSQAPNSNTKHRKHIHFDSTFRHQWWHVMISRFHIVGTHPQTPFQFSAVITITHLSGCFKNIHSGLSLSAESHGCLLGTTRKWCQLLKSKPLISSNRFKQSSTRWHEKWSVWQQALATEEKLTKSGFRPILVRKLNKLQAIIHCCRPSPIQAPK